MYIFKEGIRNIFGGVNFRKYRSLLFGLHYPCIIHEFSFCTNKSQNIIFKVYCLMILSYVTHFVGDSQGGHSISPEINLNRVLSNLVAGMIST